MAYIGIVSHQYFRLLNEICSFPGSFYPHSDSFLYPPVQISGKPKFPKMLIFLRKISFPVPLWIKISIFLVAGQQKLPGNERIRRRSDPTQKMSFQLPIVAEKSSFSQNPRKRTLFWARMKLFGGFSLSTSFSDSFGHKYLRFVRTWFSKHYFLLLPNWDRSLDIR